MSSITLTLTGETSSLNSFFYPEIVLDKNAEYSCCLLDLFTYNSIPNINEKNNKFYYEIGKSFEEYQYEVVDSDAFIADGSTILTFDSASNMQRVIKIVTIPVGTYELDEIISFLNNEFVKQKDNITISSDKNTMKCSINSDFIIDFTKNNCIGSVLGFSKRFLQKGENKSDKLVDIQHINNLRIECDLVTGSYHNGKSTHTIYEFNPSVDPGYKISEHPKHLIYLPITRRRISTVNVSIVDQDGALIDFRGEQITCRLHIKRNA